MRLLFGLFAVWMDVCSLRHSLKTWHDKGENHRTPLLYSQIPLVWTDQENSAFIGLSPRLFCCLGSIPARLPFLPYLFSANNYTCSSDQNQPETIFGPWNQPAHHAKCSSSSNLSHSPKWCFSGKHPSLHQTLNDTHIAWENTSWSGATTLLYTILIIVYIYIYKIIYIYNNNYYSWTIWTSLP